MADTTQQPRFPKRHASFHSPREVPLPSPNREKERPFFDPLDDTDTHPWHDRFSSASLPIPSQIPYFTLPNSNDSPLVCPPLDESNSESSTSSDSSSDLDKPPPPPQQSPPPPPRPSSPPTAMRRPPSLASSVSSLPGYTPASYLPPYSPPPPSSASASGYASTQPEAPTILEDEPHPNDGRALAPYEVFLNRAPQPADSWLQIETLQMEYRLFARLPGFTREGITLATKRRRILHLVADKWDRDGGHFERRISFGHDADLMQVRAEFDGEMLKVYIPRRQPAWCNSRIAYSRG